MLILEWKKICKELKKIFGEKATDKIWSHLSSLHQRIKELETSRDNWKNKYMKLKKKNDN